MIPADFMLLWLFLPLMDIQHLLAHFNEQISATPLMEWIAVITGIVSVLLARKNHAGLYPAGIVSTSLYTIIMYRVGLYAESGLNLYYLLMSIYGWALWAKYRESGNPKAIGVNGRKDWIITVSIVLGGFTILYLVLSQYTSSTVPFWDALVAATAWAGMWLLAKHKLENWILLNISNLIAIPLYIYKGIPLTALLTVFLFIVAISGYIRWRRQRLNQQNTAI